MKVYISGASGLVGSSLSVDLASAGHSVHRLVRDRALAVGGDVYWNPAAGELDAQAIADCDAVVNLSGESIAARRWSAQQKQKILDSRTSATRTIAQALSKADGRPKTLVNASAIGIYGDRGDEWLDESSAPGNDFLADVCRQWEAATEPSQRGGARVVCTRFGVIFSGRGGALQKMLLPFRLGVGGKLGSGRQYMSWVTLDDAVDCIIACLSNSAIAGPVNVVSPQPVTNYEFTKTLGRVLRRPTIFPLPAPVARIVLGEMADGLLLAGQRVRPAALSAAGYDFRFPDLERALRHVLFPPVRGVGFG
jgi:uncharacterized protein (TIGR01777 family)